MIFSYGSEFKIFTKRKTRNIEVRKTQKIPHTGGAKLLSTKQHEMEIICSLLSLIKIHGVFYCSYMLIFIRK